MSEKNKIAEAIGFLQERGYSVTATEDNIVDDVDIETLAYIANNVNPNRVYPLYEIESLLDNEKLTSNSIREDIKSIVGNFPQETGKPEQIMI